MARRKPKPVKPPAISICILAGGLSSRMGRDKSRIRIGRRTMLGHVRHVASQLGLPVRVPRRDAVPRCGPIGGIYTALARSRSDAILFLACDMPFVTPAFLTQLLSELRATSSTAAKRSRSPSPLNGERDGVRGVRTLSRNRAIFASHKKLFGLPCLIPHDGLPTISRQIAKSRFSLQSLARALKAKPLTPSRRPALQLHNLNTPADLESARRPLKNPYNHKP
jgi:molybdopterin-guanine dinucleotide biosynthesis protein A